MADQFSALELLLDPDEQYDDPIRRKALAASLRKQNAYGSLGQLMGVEPTVRAGTAMQEQSQGSLKMALAKQQAAKEAEARAAERRQAELWQQQNFAQRERGIEATRVNRAASGPVIQTDQGTVRVTPDNVAVPITTSGGGQVRPVPKQPTESQATAANFARQYEQNLPVVLNAIDKGYIPNQVDSALGTTTYNNTVTSNAARAAMSDEGKQFYDAAKVLINAVMRRESGAAISASEWQNAFERWLPRPGDSPELVAQKRANLEAQLGNFIEQAGPAYTKREEKPAEPAAQPPAAQPPVYKYDRQGNLIGGP